VLVAGDTSETVGTTVVAGVVVRVEGAPFDVDVVVVLDIVVEGSSYNGSVTGEVVAGVTGAG